MKYFLLFLLLSLAQFAVAQADYIFHNGKIFTSDKQNLWTEAIAVKDGKILAVGKNADILKLKGGHTKVTDLKQHLLIPGINDAHNHVGSIYPARRFSLADDILTPTPWNLVRDSINQVVKEIPAGTFIIATINPDLLDDPAVTRYSLDSIAPKNPVMLSAWTGHGKIMNSAALEFFGFSEQTSFAGGNLKMDGGGKLNGIVEEYAGYQAGPRLATRLSDEKIISDLTNFYNHASSLGITTVQNMCTQLSTQQVMRIYSKNEFACRVRLIAVPFTNKKELLLNEWQNNFHPLGKTNYVSGVKLILDGTPVERLACMRQAYEDRPGWFGRLNFNERELKKYMQYSVAHNQQIIIHAVGDSTITTIIRTMRSLHPVAFWKNKRLRIEHGEMAIMKKEDINTLKQLGIVIVQNPTHLAIPPVMNTRLGTGRMKYVQAMRTLLDNHIPLAIGSDGPDNPFLNLMLATMHPDNPKEAITLEEALIAYTYGSAYAEFKEKEKGTLAKGMQADFSVLSQDIFSIAPNQLPATHSMLTMTGGKIVYESKEAW